ncbi:hypothetical protein [Mycobacterium sp. 236(2023)]|uniref:hypothetical protein n=1 Tax=Mycobacterium sp. 236(2023) TaxID=3038163 RepID=UPI00241564B0|nr:hypothetical protein [Mycobacterium sp. 236(2023)]MDG4664221.1 hypothetical protein [Mycobacterium sp. 236(2023)]
MESKGFKRHARGAAIAAVSFGVVLGATAPVAAAQEGSWTMPSLREEVLQNAVDSVLEAAGADNVTFNIYDAGNNQVVYNYTNWVVCGQSPRADATVKVGEKPQRVSMALQRRASGC